MPLSTPVAWAANDPGAVSGLSRLRGLVPMQLTSKKAEDGLTLRPWPGPFEVTTGEQALKRFEDRIVGIYKRMIDDILSKKLAALSPSIEEISELTANAKIRKMSQDCIQALGK